MDNPVASQQAFFPHAPSRSEHALANARQVIPVLLDLVEKPHRVVDLGGGTGAWCKAFKEHGVPSVLCIDHPLLDAGQLLVASHEYAACDLSRAFPAPVPADLAVCLELAEHLEATRSDALVGFLAACAPLVLFSAAIPGQPGHRHVNLQPPAFWKDRFAQYGFERLDLLRPRLITLPEVSYWLRQNAFLYARPEGRAKVRAHDVSFPGIPDDFELVHERVLNRYRNPVPLTLGGLIRGLWPALRRSASYRLARRRNRTPRPVSMSRGGRW
jgi:hypothetical protein